MSILGLGLFFVWVYRVLVVVLVLAFLWVSKLECGGIRRSVFEVGVVVVLVACVRVCVEGVSIFGVWVLVVV